jgi:RNA repair pathway DNA polymerase beta family
MTFARAPRTEQKSHVTLSAMTRAEQLVSAVEQSQFLYLDSLIHLFVGGSELHGAKVKDTDDLDIYGVYLEPPELVLGLDKQDFYVWSTAGNERRNTADDIDVCLYSLRKWAGLAAKGNPTGLHFLFSQNYAPRPEPWDRVLKSPGTYFSRGRQPSSSVGLPRLKFAACKGLELARRVRGMS